MLIGALRERLRVQANTILRLRALADAHGIRVQHDRIVAQEEATYGTNGERDVRPPP